MFLLAATSMNCGVVPPAHRHLSTPDVASSPPLILASDCPNSVRVETAAQLEATLRSSFVGCVLVARDRSLNMTGRSGLPIHAGVSLMGERGALGSRPTIFTDSLVASDDQPLFVFAVASNDVRISGLHLIGPEHGDRTDRAYAGGIHITEDPDNRLGRNILIEDCELEQWTGSAVAIDSVHSARIPRRFLPTWHRLSKGDAGLVLVQHNYIHNNSMDGGGYGVTVSTGAWATVEANVFDFNRHAVASDGFANTGYIARHNYVLNGGFMQGDYYNQHFDVHGTNDTDGDERSTGYGGYAGEYYEIVNNTIRGNQGYFVGFKTRPSCMLRGTPTAGAYFSNNIDVHVDLDSAVALKGTSGATGMGEDQSNFNFHANGNRFRTDNSGNLAAGDFDGDGRTDVVLTTGNAWFYSSAGSEPWQFLRLSDKVVGDLGFADVDHDGTTDILYKDDSGRVVYLKSGRVPPAVLTEAPVPIRDIRYGDFDGDGKADLFYAASGVWHVWYGASGQWKVTATSSLPISTFLFGEFDDVKGTDVAAVTSGMWAYSSGGAGGWTQLNASLRPSFDRAVAVDIDGNGKSDIIFDEQHQGESKWYWSRDGRGPVELFRDGTHSYRYPALRDLPIGRFDGTPTEQIISYYVGAPNPRLDDHFLIWRGGPNREFVSYSREPMK